MNDPFFRLGATMVRRRWRVLAVWLVLLVVGGALAPQANNVVVGGGFAVPGSNSARAGAVLAAEFHADTRTLAQIVLRSDSATVDDAGFRAQVLSAITRVKAVDGVLSTLSYYDSGEQALVSKDRHTTLVLVSVKPKGGEGQWAIPKLRDALKGLPLQHYVTGYSAINYDTFVASEDDLRSTELFTVPIVLVLLLLIFRTVVAALIPLILAAFSVVLALAAIFVMGLIADTSVFALNIASLIGLGLSIDYSLVVITRYREERAAGYAIPDAVARTTATAGRSIIYSGITVILSMLALTLLVHSLMIVRSISIGVLMVVFIGMIAALTLLPAVLGILDHRIERLRIIRRPIAAPGQATFWYQLSRAIMHRPWVWLISALVIMGILASPIRDLALVGPSPGVLPADTESIQGIRALDRAFGANRLTPIQIVIQTDPGGVWKPEFLAALQHLTNMVAADPRTAEVQSLSTLATASGMPPAQFSSLTAATLRANPRVARLATQFVSLNGANDAAVIVITSKYGEYNSRNEAFIYDLRNTIIPQDAQLHPYTVTIGGDASGFLDFRDALYGRFPLIVLVVTVMIFIILLMFFQSVFLPLKAMFMNIVSILATYGVLVAIFQYGWGSGLFGFTSQGLLNAVTPAILYVILFSLSTDYEVFMLSRIKEQYHLTRNNQEAVASGMQQTAGMITAAGLILIGTFGSFAIARAVPLKEVGLGLAIGVLLDSTIVRVIMVPATMRLMGDWNWWMPAWLKRIVPELREGPAPEPLPAASGLATAAAGQSLSGTQRGKV